MMHFSHHWSYALPRPGRKAPAPSFFLMLTLLSSTGCSLLHSSTSPEKEVAAVAGAPSKNHYRQSQYVFYSDFPLNKNSPIFQELSDLRDQVFKELQLPESNRLIQVYLFEDEEKYERYMRSKYPDLPVRRAFFIEQPKGVGISSDLMVFTYWGDTIRQDLRHELTHGLLHSVLPSVPIWLDEGLAEVFELPPDRNGVNAKFLGELRRGPVQPDLARLEHLTQVDQMLKEEYKEAWAWVHMMLRGKPEGKAVLLAYLQQLRTQSSNPGGLLAKLKSIYPSPNDALAEHLSHIKSPVAARASSPQ